eukprot:RCo045720
MVLSTSWSSSSWEVPEEGFSVSLNVYDLSQGFAAALSGPILGLQLDGIWHSGLVVYGREFFYGGGICVDEPGRTPYGVPKETLLLGTTQLPPALFSEFLAEASSRYRMQDYSLLTHNCNHFTDECAKLLLGSGIPVHIVNLPQTAMASPLLRSWAPLVEQMQRSFIDNFMSQASTTSASPAPAVASAAAATAMPSRPFSSSMGGRDSGGVLPGEEEDPELAEAIRLSLQDQAGSR